MRGLALDDREQEASFAVEVAVNQALRATSALCDLAGGGWVIAMLGEDRVGSFNQVGFALFRVSGPWLVLGLQCDWALLPQLVRARARTSKISNPGSDMSTLNR
jgi:hypothetical protein